MISTSPSAGMLILASSSPRRQALLQQAGYAFDAVLPEVNEEDFPANVLPVDLAIQLARAKARQVADRHPRNVVLGADTVVAFGDRILGKPRDAADARRILGLLSGTTHIVITGVAVVHADVKFREIRRVLSAVRMRVISPSEIDRYIDTGLWEGKAGGYGIQDGNPFIKGVVGCISNVVGLPMSTTRQLLSAAGIEPRRH